LGLLQLRRKRLWHWFENQFRGYGNRIPQCAVDRTLLREKPVHTPGGFMMRIVRLQLQLDMNTPDDQDVVVELDFAYSLGDEALIGS
jgi:hypothetical protein